MGKYLAKVLLAPLIFFLGIAGYNITSNNNLGAYNVTGGGTYRLQSSVGLSDATINLSSFKEPISNIPYSMSYLNSSIEYGTIDPSNSTNKEFISFTGITQNADGTAQLTGVSRGMEFSYPFTASSTLQKTHSGQSVFILSNSPQVYNQFANKTNTESLTGTWTFLNTAVPRLSATHSYVAGEGLYFTTKDYVDSVAAFGAPLANETVAGISELATAAELALGTSVGGTGARLVLPNSSATTSNGWSGGLTSTPIRLPIPGAYIPITDPLTGQLDPSLVNFYFAFNQANTINGPITFTATTTMATTTITDLTATNLKLGGVSYTFPSVLGASSTALVANNASGKLIWYPVYLAAPYAAGDNLLISSDIQHNSTSASTTVKEIALNGAGTITVYFELQCSSANPCAAQIYKNDVAVGTYRRISTTGSWTGYYENVTGVVATDKIQIKATGGGSFADAYVQNFKIKINRGYDGSVVNTQ